MSIALNWGRHYGSCPEALIWRGSLGPQATQADAWRECQRGDWLLWQLRRLPWDVREETRPAMRRAIDRIVTRAIRRGQRALRGVRAPWATVWRRWARAWLDGTDRTAATASDAANVAAGAAAWVAEAAWVAAEKAEEAAAAWMATEAATEEGVAVAAAREADAREVEAVVAAAKARELLLQACDIHAEVPEWPGEPG